MEREPLDILPCPNKMDDLGIVVIIPTFNNDKTLLSIIKGVQKYARQIIVVNDGSTDQTSEILQKIEGIHILKHEKNKGKGYALKNGLLFAKQKGYRYAITIDSDGQHYPSDILSFVDEIEKTPDQMLIGARNLAASNMPGKNTFANKFSNFWYLIETGIRLEDTQSGYRLYPLHLLGSMRYYTAKYEFELEIIVFLAWKGVPVRNIPIKVYYPPENERVSHFRPLRDFTRISLLNTLLVSIAFLWIYPLRFLRKLTWSNIRKLIDREVLKSKDSNLKITFSIMFGVFMGIIPIWGYQMLATLFFAHFMKLNKAIALIASNISIPPFMPFLLYGSYLTGCWVTNTRVIIGKSEINVEVIKTVLYQYLTGSIVFAIVCAIISGIISGCLLFVFRKDNSIKDIDRS